MDTALLTIDSTNTMEHIIQQMARIQHNMFCTYVQNMIVRFESFGFCRIEAVEKDEIVAYFAHK